MIYAECKAAGIDPYMDPPCSNSLEEFMKSCRNNDHPLYREYWKQLDAEIEYDTETLRE